jgi:hypothetical protein
VKEKEVKTKLDFETLREMVAKSEDQTLIDKIENETEKDVQEAWLDFFFTNVARCPKCKRHVERAEVINCECGQVTRIMK